MTAKRCRLFHWWTEWSEPIKIEDHINWVQMRRCRRCKKYQKRIV